MRIFSCFLAVVLPVVVVMREHAHWKCLLGCKRTLRWSQEVN